MKNWSFYATTTGLFSGQHFSATDESLLDSNTPAGHAAIDGLHDHLSTRVDLATGCVCDYIPPAPSDDHEWHADKKRWLLKPAEQQRRHADKNARAYIEELEAKSLRALREIVLQLADTAGVDASRLAELHGAIIAARKDVLL